MGRIKVSASAEEIVSNVISSMDPLGVPDIIRSSIEKHRSNLLNLAATLINGGYDREIIEASLDSVFGSFRREVIKVVLELNESKDA